METGYRKAHEHNRDVYEQIDRMFSGKESVGIRVWDKAAKYADMTIPTVMENSCSVEDMAFSPAIKMLTSCSLPITYGAPQFAGVAFGEDIKAVPKEQLNSGLILDLRYVKMAYYKGEAVAFFIGVPDYGARVYNTKNLINLAGVLKRKKKAEAYVLPYLGALPEHAGLGAALTGAMMVQLKETGGESIGALCRDGKISGHYAKAFFDNEYEYVLLSRETGRKA